ncbi:TPA: molecular chaperone DnaJ [Salmonella enterica]|nr:molecular chaperone DnaJ [Salmonella enterica]EJR3529467.1 molecular chaperone DnaJ [Salmonella enterica]SYF73597.1 DnaJ-like molecular chaperone [Klebsiella pneumoniae]VGH86457.1 DnaJ-like molecular chaperone [Klebsiella pneumoniae]
MTAAICDVCHGSGGPIEIECPNCSGTGYDPTDDKPFAQCHTCYGDQTIEIDECTNCGGIGEVVLNDF